MKKQRWIKLLGKLKYSKLEMLIAKNGLFGLGRKQLLRFIGEIIEGLQAKTIKEACKRVKKEHIDYKGLINFASKGIETKDDLGRAFDYGKEVGIEIIKTDCIRILKEMLLDEILEEVGK